MTITNTSKYSVMLIRFADIDTSAPFFDSFRAAYSPYYDQWIKNKSDDFVYAVFDGGDITAFLKLKVEDDNEDYSDIEPALSPARRIKISSLKVLDGHPGLSSQFIEIALTLASKYYATEIYATIAQKCQDKLRLISFLHKHNFKWHGVKESHGIQEDVYVSKIIQFHSPAL